MAYPYPGIVPSKGLYELELYVFLSIIPKTPSIKSALIPVDYSLCLVIYVGIGPVVTPFLSFFMSVCFGRNDGSKGKR